MKGETDIYNKLISLLDDLGYASEMFKMEFKTETGRSVDLVISSGEHNLIAFEIKSKTDIFNADSDEISYHPIARKIQRNAEDIGAKYYAISNGVDILWMTTGEKGRPQIIEPIEANQLEIADYSKQELVSAMFSSLSNIVRVNSITGDLHFDMSIVLFLKVKGDLDNIKTEYSGMNEDFRFDGQYEISKSLVYQIKRWRHIDANQYKQEILDKIDSYQQEHTFEWNVPKWVSKMMVDLYPSNQIKNRALNFIARSGSISTSLLNDGWKNVMSFYNKQSNEYWIRCQQLLFGTGLESIEFKQDLITSHGYNEFTQKYDSVLLAPPYGLKLRNEYGVKSDSTIVLIEKALQYSKPDGYLIVLVPNGFLFSSRFKKSRNRLRTKYHIHGIINLPSSAFKPYSSVSTSILIIQNKVVQNGATFLGSIESIKSTELRSSVDEVIKQYQNFTSKVDFKPRIKSFLIEKLDDENFHYSKYWVHQNQLNSESLSMGYQAIPLKELVTIIQRGNNYKKDPIEEVAYLSPGAIRSMKIRRDGLSYTRSSLRPVNPIIVFENDIIINIIGTQRGSAALVSKDIEGLGLNHHLVLLKPNTNLVIPHFLALALNSHFVQSQLHDQSTGTVIPSLSIRSFQSISIPVPPYNIQKEITQRFLQINQEINSKEQELKELKEKLKKILFGIGKMDKI